MIKPFPAIGIVSMVNCQAVVQDHITWCIRTSCWVCGGGCRLRGWVWGCRLRGCWAGGCRLSCWTNGCRFCCWGGGCRLRDCWGGRCSHGCRRRLSCWKRQERRLITIHISKIIDKITLDAFYQFVPIRIQLSWHCTPKHSGGPRTTPAKLLVAQSELGCTKTVPL